MFSSGDLYMFIECTGVWLIKSSTIWYFSLPHDLMFCVAQASRACPAVLRRSGIGWDCILTRGGALRRSMKDIRVSDGVHDRGAVRRGDHGGVGGRKEDGR
jgi:hypothetical protein